MDVGAIWQGTWIEWDNVMVSRLWARARSRISIRGRKMYGFFRAQLSRVTIVGLSAAFEIGVITFQCPIFMSISRGRSRARSLHISNGNRRVSRQAMRWPCVLRVRRYFMPNKKTTKEKKQNSIEWWTVEQCSGSEDTELKRERGMEREREMKMASNCYWRKMCVWSSITSSIRIGASWARNAEIKWIMVSERQCRCDETKRWTSADSIIRDTSNWARCQREQWVIASV